ncbi:mono-functional DNA-alkylating methyl methanesulfonate N-term-domain-containing protein [Mucor lusitanicus]|uniref:Mono-functional DNA-alkylating methyl methanesulfonate N-term-domain-containing protein n=1 Tax=Mucor circinelloides f. lusitanicus TaxID=29924 RepID=A0A8H4F5S2_MUCCL|nr:mono-functional DNA-alkylating methyl methanesulfonate N-term-domain-containing protein [Mucor lusitanicus]
MSYAKKTRRHARIQGNDVIVALSEYGKLVFITIIQDALTRRFETLAEVYLDSPGLEYTKKGKKLAIDPCGRAIAIASFQDHFDILILDKTTSRIHFDPIIGRGSEFEEGIIWQMEFLHTESDAMDRILLVLTVYNDVERLCRLVLYSIDASDMKNVTIEKISRLPLEKNTPLPLLLIPLSFQTEAFLLVTEQNVSYLKADDLACGNVLYPTSQIPRNLECSSEGHLYRLGVDVWGEREVNIDWQPLDATSPISQAMCVLGRMDVEEPRGFRGTDVLLCAGESADNHVLAMCTSTLPFRRDVVQTIVNRAPLTDYQVADNFIGDQDAIITCSGQDLHGALSIVTHGIEATHMAQSSRYEWKGVSRLWQIKASVSLKEQVSCLVVSSLLDTRLLCAKGMFLHKTNAKNDSSIQPNTMQMATSRTLRRHPTLSSTQKQCMQHPSQSTTTVCCFKCM